MRQARRGELSAAAAVSRTPGPRRWPTAAGLREPAALRWIGPV